jgi:hypothetical protein
MNVAIKTMKDGMGLASLFGGLFKYPTFSSFPFPTSSLRKCRILSTLSLLQRILFPLRVYSLRGFGEAAQNGNKGKKPKQQKQGGTRMRGKPQKSKKPKVEL